MPRQPIVKCPTCKCFFYWLGTPKCPCGATVTKGEAFPQLIDVVESKKKVVVV